MAGVQGSAGDAYTDSRRTRAAARVPKLRTAAGKRVKRGGGGEQSLGVRVELRKAQ
jgi:hypothetical protein